MRHLKLKQPVEQMAQPRSKYPLFATMLYLLLIVYGTLFPLSEWQWAKGGLDVLLNTSWPESLTRTDVIINLLIYIPMGYLFCHWLKPDNPSSTMIYATLLGAALSILLEYLQTYLPSRVSSYVDITLNTAGTMLGAALAVMTNTQTKFAERILKYKTDWFVTQPLTNLALLTLLFWALSQLTPLVPSPDIANLRNGVKLLYYTLITPSSFDISQAFNYFLNIFAIGLLLSIFLNPDQGLVLKLAGFIFFVLVLKIPIIDRQLSLEALVGAGIAIILCTFFINSAIKFRAFFSICLLLTAYTISGLSTSGESEFLQKAMNWVPFAPQMQTDSIFGLVDIVISIWPFMALACLVLVISPKGSILLGMFGIVGIFSLSFYIEWRQMFFTNRYPDITDVFLAVTTFTIAYWQFRKYSYVRPEYNYQPVGRMVE
ncbi:MAG: VanZ family protein [Thiohalomonadales bacterium]